MGLLIPSRRSNKIVTQINADGSYGIPTGTLIDVIELLPGGNMAGVMIGTTPGGEEIMTVTDLVAGETSLLGTLIKGPATIYFTNVTADLQITLYKK